MTAYYHFLHYWLLLSPIFVQKLVTNSKFALERLSRDQLLTPSLLKLAVTLFSLLLDHSPRMNDISRYDIIEGILDDLGRFNLRRVVWSVIPIHLHNAHIQQIVNRVTFYFPKYSVLLIQIARFIQSYEKLAPISPRATIRHSYDSSS